MPTRQQGKAPGGWRRRVVQYIADHPDRPLKAKSLARELGIANNEYNTFRAVVRELLDTGELTLGPGRTLRVPGAGGRVVGTFRSTRRGFGFLEVPGHPDVYIPQGQTGGALEGDTVAARVLPPRGRDRDPRAAVVRIVERAAMNWVGRLERVSGRWFVRPMGKAANQLIEVDDPAVKSASEGDLVVAEPIESDGASASMRGVIVERLGAASDTQNKILATCRRFDIAEKFPPAVRRAARRAAQRLDPSAVKGREDLRRLLTITIDPADARDFDDAISIERLKGDRYRLGVHIADVSHFVQPDGVLDREARERSTSVYFPGFVVPMLPETLSNGVCSLRPDEDRLTKSVFITVDRNGRVTGSRLANSIIRSDRRLTYEQASAALDGDPGGLPSRVLDLLRDANRLARRIQKRRDADGMIVLALPEVHIRLDKAGKVIDAQPADTSFSHTIIEMFMVEANEAVCRAMVKADLPHLRRVHADPGPDASQSLAQITTVLGRKMPATIDRETIRALLDAARGRPEELAVNYAVLRSMSRAEYSPALEGHFALASRDYCHFTSPIRRYPDLLIHRLVDRLVIGDATPSEADAPDQLIRLGQQTSAAERRAQQAERDVKNMLLLEFMKARVGEVFDGIVTGVLSIGAFVQIFPHLAEGLVNVADFGPDNWQFDREQNRLVSRAGRVVAVGMRVRVQIASVDEFRQELNLVPAVAGSFGVRSGKPGREPRREKRPEPRRTPRRRKTGGRKKRGHQEP